MVFIGLILLLVGLFASIQILVIVGAIVGAVGLLLLLTGASGHAVGGRRYWY